MVCPSVTSAPCPLCYIAISLRIIPQADYFSFALFYSPCDHASQVPERLGAHVSVENDLVVEGQGHGSAAVQVQAFRAAVFLQFVRQPPEFVALVFAGGAPGRHDQDIMIRVINTG